MFPEAHVGWALQPKPETVVVQVVTGPSFSRACGGEMSARIVRVWCCVMLLVFPASMLLAESQAAMVMVSGVAALNGTAMAASTTIFAGDLLETGANSALTINAKGSTIRIGANSRVHYFGDSIELLNGS